MFNFILLSFITKANDYSQLPALMPMPQKLEWKQEFFKIDSSFSISINGISSPRLTSAIERFNMRLDKRVLQYFKKNIQKNAKLNIENKAIGIVKLGVDESYTLSINSNNIIIKSNTDIGSIRALETLMQLIVVKKGNYYFQGCEITDNPRFAWRGLLIDVCRHFIPKDGILRNIDAMAALKMSVLHLHLTEDQGFRIESKTFPKLHEMGSNGKYFTQQDIKDIIKYADDRGIRVVPEFDLPGHSTSWLVAYPEFSSGNGTYTIEKRFGVFDPTFNPANENIYPFFDAFLKEMADLFPDEYIHIGGDENNGVQWAANPSIQKFIKDNNLVDNHGLQAYFNQKLHKILSKYKKKMIGWDEIMSPQLPNDILIQSWRGKEAMIKAAKSGIPSLLSSNYYIDLCQPTWFHYQNDPLPDDVDLTEEQKKFILGGEATMWSELVSEETVDSRIWPRTAAIAERFWSASNVKNAVDMYLRLAKMEIILEELGINYRKNQEMLSRRFLGGVYDTDFMEVLEMIEPVKNYSRHSYKPYSTDIPLCQLPDIAYPDSKFAIEVFINTELYMQNKDKRHLETILSQINDKKNHLSNLIKKADTYPNLLPFKNYLNKLNKSLDCLSETINKIDKPKEEQWLANIKPQLEEISKPELEVEIGFIPSVKKLIKHYEEK